MRLRFAWAAAIATIVGLAGGAGCGGDAPVPEPLPEQAASAEQEPIDALADTELPTDEAGDATDDDDASSRRRTVTLYWPSLGGDGLRASEVSVYDTPAPEDVARQILAGLLAGTPPRGAARAVPSGTVLRQVYIHRRVAWVNFNGRLRDGLGGGSARELATVYAIVDSLALNLPGVDRVGILIDGRPVDTLNGHVDLSRPLRPEGRRLRARA